MRDKLERSSDRWPCKRLWDLGTPWVQVIGWFLVMGAIGGGLLTTIRSSAATLDIHEKRLTEVEQNYSVINQKLDDMIFYLHIPQKGEK